MSPLTVEQFDRMVETGILTDEDRVELLEGLLVAMTPIGTVHAACVDHLAESLTLRLAGRAAVRAGNPVALPLSRLYPDLAVVQRRADYYAGAMPVPADVFAVIEVADASLRRDRDVKLPAYGRAGVPACWVVDVVGKVVIAASEPGTTGYGRLAVHEPGEALAVPGLPDVVLTIDEILGPALLAMPGPPGPRRRAARPPGC